MADFAALLKSYGLSSVTGDRYAGEWPREQFRKAGIEYQLSDKAKSDLYRDLLPMLNSGQGRAARFAATIDPARKPGTAYSARWTRLN